MICAASSVTFAQVSTIELAVKVIVIVLVPVPLSPACNQSIEGSNWQHEHACRYAQLALGIWYLDESRFAEFHKWVMTPHHAPELNEAVEYATQLVESAPLRESILGRRVKGRIKNNVFLYSRAGRGSVPKMLIGRELVTGSIADADEMTELIRKFLPIP